jgi:transposase-like protein
MRNDELNLATLSKLFVDEDAAHAFIESKLWPDGPVCPRCGSAEAYKLTAKPTSKRPVRPGVYKCKYCRKQFTVRIGTIFEDSHIPFSKWLMGLHLLTSSKKGFSALQLSRELGITVKSAWFLLHRVREAMRPTHPDQSLSGVVEADETYVGGKPRHKGAKPGPRKDGKKSPVTVLVERDGKAICGPIDNVRSEELRALVIKNIDPSSTVVTDEHHGYKCIKNDFQGGHKVVNHTRREYVNDEGYTTNTAESFFALLKRGHYGVYHMMSKQHLHRYATEFEFRWNHRKVTDGARMVAAILGAEGKRLKYKQPA